MIQRLPCLLYVHSTVHTFYTIHNVFSTGRWRESTDLVQYSVTSVDCRQSPPVALVVWSDCFSRLFNVLQSEYYLPLCLLVGRGGIFTYQWAVGKFPSPRSPGTWCPDICVQPHQFTQGWAQFPYSKFKYMEIYSYLLKLHCCRIEKNHIFLLNFVYTSIWQDKITMIFPIL
jgi:hypothetical protein